MRGKLFQLGVFLVASGILSGCKTAGPLPEKKNPDPLCVSHKPVEVRALDAEPAAVVRIDPQPPPLPIQPSSAIVRQRSTLGPPQPITTGLE
jgi:hypothetical protein